LSGQAGKGSAAFLWDSETCEVKKRFQLADGFNGVAACSISADNKQICLAENSADGCIQVLSVDDGSVVYSTSIKKNILAVQFSFDGRISVAAEKYFGIIEVGKSITECELNNNGPKTTHCSTCWDEKGRAYSGGSNGLVYIWENNACTSTVQFHAEGFVCALKYSNGKIASGGKAGQVNVWDPDTLEIKLRIDFGVLVRAVDITDVLCLVGLRDGSIKFFPMDTI
jgi:WD40 repeat protein